MQSIAIGMPKAASRAIFKRQKFARKAAFPAFSLASALNIADDLPRACKAGRIKHMPNSYHCSLSSFNAATSKKSRRSMSRQPKPVNAVARKARAEKWMASMLGIEQPKTKKATLIIDIGEYE